MSTKTVFSATELERFADCSSAWLVERVIDPKTIDAEPDPMLRGQVVHTTLNRFYAALPQGAGLRARDARRTSTPRSSSYERVWTTPSNRESGSISRSCRRRSYARR